MPERILEKLERELSGGAKKGQPLRGEFQWLWRLRIGDYRVIYARTEDGFFVLRIGATQPLGGEMSQVKT